MSDPTEMTDQERAAGHQGVKDTMHDDVRALCEASGSVADHRRLVAFIYLLVRDNMPFGLLGEVMCMWKRIDSVKRVFLYQGLDEDALDNNARRIAPDDMLETVRDWLALVYRQSRNPTHLPALIEQLPLSDDIETIFTNGWAAQYAKHVASQLEAHART